MPEFAAFRALRTAPAPSAAAILAELSGPAVLRGALRARRMEALALAAHLTNLADRVDCTTSAGAHVVRARDHLEAALTEINGALLRFAEEPQS